MKSLLRILVIILFFLTDVLSSITVEVNVGDSFRLTLETYILGDKSAKCYLTSPQNKHFNFKPINDAEDRFVLSETSLFSDCEVTINDIQESDEGTWILTYETETTENKISRYLKPITNGNSDLETDDVSNNDTNKIKLENISIKTKVGNFFDISLSNRGYEESCYLYRNDNTTMYSDDEMIDSDVVVKQKTSDFVSCRMTVGPMEADLLGKWTLCGKRLKNGEEEERCQTADVTWANDQYPSSVWDTTINIPFRHVVHFGGILTPGVGGHESGVVQSCSIITPDGEELAITNDSDYPNLQRADSVTSACKIAIGPIQSNLIGEGWILSGKFYSSVWGFYEVRLPFSMELYDEDNPYNPAYNTTTIASETHIVNIGNNIQKQVTNNGVVEECEFITPENEVYFKSNQSKQYDGVTFEDVGSLIACRISVGPITKNMIGQWELIGKFSNNGIYTAIVHNFDIIEQDPENPVEDDRRHKIYENPLYFNTHIGSNHEVSITKNPLGDHESCHLRTPLGLQYILMEGFNVTGVEMTPTNNMPCSIKIEVSKDTIGDWVLIAREYSFTLGFVERRLNFTIYVEEIVEANPYNVNIVEGNNMYVRLTHPTNHYETCKLFTPDGKSPHSYSIDESYDSNCGFIVKNINLSESGQWEITYEDKIIYRAKIIVSVKAKWSPLNVNFTWIRDQPALESFGPKDSLYCRIVDPNGITISDNYGPCHISLESVKAEHEGLWKFFLGQPGSVVSNEYDFNVFVIESAAKPEVTTSASFNHDLMQVHITCSLQSSKILSTCKFRAPNKDMIIASHAVGNDFFYYHGNQSVNEFADDHSCGLVVTRVTVTEMGIWRCVMITEDNEAHYGFLRVLTPWLNDASIVADPVLKSHSDAIQAVEGMSVTMLCSIDAAVKYCYFRSTNGTVFGISEDSSFTQHDYKYAGAGFSAGECGATFQNLLATDSGVWSCHVGLHDLSAEQTAGFNVTIQEEMTLNQTLSDGLFQVELQVYDSRSIDYCRFVRFDGFGFTHETANNYTVLYDLSRGWCKLVMTDPTNLDLQPWTAVVRIRGQQREVSRVSEEAFYLPPAKVPVVVMQSNLFTIYLWTGVCFMLIAATLVVASLASTKNRKWLTDRTSSARSSFRDSFRRFPLFINYNEKKALPA